MQEKDFETVAIDIDQVEKDWHSKGFSFSLWTEPPGKEWKDYEHSLDKLLMVVEGKIELEIGGVRKHPVIGEEIHIPAGVRHMVRNVGDTPSILLYGHRKEQSSEEGGAGGEAEAK